MEIDEIQPWPAGAWQRLLAEVITRVGELIAVAGGPPAADGGPSAAAAERQFAVRVPWGFAKRIRLRPAACGFARSASGFAFNSAVTSRLSRVAVTTSGFRLRFQLRRDKSLSRVAVTRAGGVSDR